MWHYSLRLLIDADAGHMTFTEEVFENQMRLPGGQWIGMNEGYTDVVCVCLNTLNVCVWHHAKTDLSVRMERRWFQRMKWNVHQVGRGRMKNGVKISIVLWTITVCKHTQKHIRNWKKSCSYLILHPCPGWEYGITIPPDRRPKSWVPSEKMYHTNRRRRWIRLRKRDQQKMDALRKVEGDAFCFQFGLYRERFFIIIIIIN